MKQAVKTLEISESARILARARRSVAGGASSTMRVLDYHLPLVVDRVEGARIWDVDGNELIDMNMAYGPLIFGHRHPLILNAIRHELDRLGTIAGFPHELSHRVAELIKKSFPSIDLLRFASSGTEAVQSALRLARAFTRRDLVVLFEGHYHGSCHDVFHRYHAATEELDARSGREAIPGTAGLGQGLGHARVLPWNDVAVLEDFLSHNAQSVAAILMEPLMGNAGTIPPRDGYLQAVRELASRHGALLIFDEVITGFRIARGGAQERYGVASDLTVLSKAMNGGLPVSAVGGNGDILKLFADGTVFHGGVYSGNPLCLAGALAVQEEFERRGESLFRSLETASFGVAQGLKEIFRKLGVPVVVQQVGAMVSLWFMKDEDPQAPRDYRELRRRADFDRYVRFQHLLQGAGVYVHPNHFECWFPSTVHDDEVMKTVLRRVEDVAAKMSGYARENAL